MLLTSDKISAIIGSNKTTNGVFRLRELVKFLPRIEGQENRKYTEYRTSLPFVALFASLAFAYLRRLIKTNGVKNMRVINVDFRNNKIGKVETQPQQSRRLTEKEFLRQMLSFALNGAISKQGKRLAMDEEKLNEMKIKGV